MKKPVVVSGMGATCSIARTIKEFEMALREGRNGIGWLKPPAGTSGPVKIGAEINDFSFQAGLHRLSSSGFQPGESMLQKADQCARRSPFPVQASVLSTLEAWQGGRLHQQKIPPHRLGLVVAGNNLNRQYSFAVYQKNRQSPAYINPRYALHFMDTDLLGTLSEIFEIRGEGFTVGNASASGTVGILKAYQLIRWGIVEACLVIGGLTQLSPLELQAFYNLGAMGGKRFGAEPARACRPFDRDHEGFIYGQASGALILETRESAEKRGAPVLAEIAGGSLVLDGNRLSNPSREGETRAMTTALEQANLKPHQIDYINTHGTSSPLGDETEIKAIKQVFKENLSQLWINSTKGLTGHCLSAAGVIECIAAIIQGREGFLHPNLNLDNPIDQQCRWVGPVYVPEEIQISMSNSFGFGGINSCIIIKHMKKKMHFNAPYFRETNS